MKTKLTRAGRRSLSIVLAVMMIISTMLIGTFTATAATVDSESVGAVTYYLWYGTAGYAESPNLWTCNEMSGNSADITVPEGTWQPIGFVISTSSDKSTLKTDSSNYSVVWPTTSTSSLDKSAMSKGSNANSERKKGWFGDGNYNFWWMKFETVVDNVIHVAYDGSNITLTEGAIDVPPSTAPSTQPTTTPSGKHSLYLYGSFQKADNWNTNYTDVPFKYDSASGWYVTHEINFTGSTSKDYPNNAYFRFYEVASDGSSKTEYCPSTKKDYGLENNTDATTTTGYDGAFYYDATSSGKKVKVYVSSDLKTIKVVEVVEEATKYTATIRSNIKVTATPTGETATVLNETGDSADVNEIQVSASTLTLTAVGVGYNFAGWKIGEGVSITSGSVTDPTITVKLKSDATIEATSITLSPRLSVNSDEVKIRTATVEENETFRLNAITKVGDKNQAAVKYTVDYYQYTNDIKNATKIGTQQVVEVNSTDYETINADLNAKIEAGETDPDPNTGHYLIGHGNLHDASITHSIDTAGTYKFYAIIKGLDSNGNVVTGNYENVSLSSSFMNDNVTVTVTKPFKKAEAYSSGLWVDVQPNETTLAKKSIALIKWTNKTGPSGTLSGNNYILYIPGGVSLTLPVYSKFSKLTINGETVDNGKTFTFEDKKSYTVQGDSTTYTLTVYQSKSDAIYTTTTTTDAKAKDGNNLPTKAYGAEIDKTIYTGQFMTSTGKDGAICNTLMDINEIKGRGNSSWEASGKFYGKYAYNIKLADKILPLNMDKNYATKAKSWCLLANNMDETGLRNVTVFEAAKRAGLSNVPEYKVADLYNNGEYLGSYLITEKVGVGKSKLVNGDTVDEHYDNTGSGNKVKAKYEYNGAKYDFQYVDAGKLKEGFSNDKLSYLLEFDLESRATEENCWFKTPKGQYVVVKAPEDVNETDMLFIINKWVEVENTVYNGTYEDIAGVLDLDSFADVYLIQEFTKNLDSGATSYYVYWDGTKANPKWQATPIWDYDWALGGHTCEKPIVTSGASDYNNKMDNATGWFTKYKCLTRADNDYDSNVLNFQAQLANNTTFWNTNVVNAWNSDIYDSIMSVYSDNGYIKTAYDANLASYNMNETRYGFITADLIVNGSANDWGSKDTGDNLADCYKYLKNWAVTRANWMSEKLTETVSVSLDASVDNDTNTITLTPSVTRSKSSTYPLTYKYYQSKDNGAYELIYETTDATYTTAKLSTGSYTYKVEATYSTYTKATSDATSAISITGNEPVLGSVTVEAPSTAITGETFTVTVTPTITSGDASTSQITYKLYTSDGTQVATKTVTGTSAAALTATAPTVETATKYTYYVTATLGGTPVTSDNFTISVNKQQGPHPVTIYFKAPSTSVYTPYVSLNGGTAVALTKDTTKNLGTIYSGALSIYWWKTTLNIDSTNTNTLKFTTKGTQANGSISDKFNGSVYYFAIDNLVSGTELVNLTGKDEYIQNFYLTPLHMASPDINNATDTNLGFTYVEGVRYRMGAKVDENGVQSVSVDSVTSAQKYIASLTPLSQLQSQLYDVNLDGEVNIDDATLIQKSLVG